MQHSRDCLECGDCCSFEIPITLFDVFRISEEMNFSLKNAFVQMVAPARIGRSGLFCIRKDEEGKCVFLSERRCSIHALKPTACRLFRCSQLADSNALDAHEQNTRKQLFWEHSVVSQVTRAYINQAGVQYNETLFLRAIDSIQRNIVTRESQKLAYGLDGKGCALGMVYDCSTCAHRGKAAGETLITLSDVIRISRALPCSHKDFFTRYIDKQPAKTPGGVLQLRRSQHCIFFDETTHCRIDAVRPMHCRFTPCPMNTNPVREYHCLYLGAGTLDEQFAHQVALDVTRTYVRTHGTSYNRSAFRQAVVHIKKVTSNNREKERFKQSIAPYRVSI
ncbi:MAG: YkgJ family cysteine cluster protein [Deltaproteobacteria bacterium]|nr:YkgJ family cysteine cluster protein [Deltaproteobacteria bacterium]MBN2673264.1 YkgJ family cysteine cluster protein [Deltaproteobacteria bacterium]